MALGTLCTWSKYYRFYERAMCLACSTKGSNLLSELQTGHQNGQDMSYSTTPCTGKSFHRGLDRRDALGKRGAENLCMGLLMQIQPEDLQHSQTRGYADPPPHFSLVPWDQHHLKEGWGKGGSRLQEGWELPSLLPALLCLLRIVREKKPISCSYFFPKSNPKHISRVSPVDNLTPQAKGQWRRDHCQSKNQSLDTMCHADGMLQAC